MTETMLCVAVVLLVLSAVGSIVAMAVVLKLARALVDAHAEPPDRDEAAEDETRRSRQMDEGFDNLMSYSVKIGHGRVTGGEP